MKTVEEHSRKVVLTNQKELDQRLHFFLLAYEASIYETTGTMPANMVFGGRYFCPVACCLGLPQTWSNL
jgi:hypothetical protein